MREIIFDTETTGLDANNDRVIEIGAVELVNRFTTGRTFHVYINPQGKEIHPDAQRVHGISMADLADKPPFQDIADQFAEFVEGAKLIAHNASFDIGFINAEFARLNLPPVTNDRVIDTLQLARRKHPMGPNSLDALCKRYGIDNSHRTLHGALLDSQLLAEVYLELIGGRQAALGLAIVESSSDNQAMTTDVSIPFGTRPVALPPRVTEAEIEAHQALVKKLGDQAIWRRISGYNAS
ncbi:MAG: DNA polymerase III subunit epsilon [Rhizobiaceae bacterium]